MRGASSQSKTQIYLGVAQLVARYLGVVEAASSSLVTQTKKGDSQESPFCFPHFNIHFLCQAGILLF